MCMCKHPNLRFENIFNKYLYSIKSYYIKTYIWINSDEREGEELHLFDYQSQLLFDIGFFFWIFFHVMCTLTFSEVKL